MSVNTDEFLGALDRIEQARFDASTKLAAHLAVFALQFFQAYMSEQGITNINEITYDDIITEITKSGHFAVDWMAGGGR